ncbi:MAG TPA: hypothetical protein VIU11_17515 [Nakamurella sp.]
MSAPPNTPAARIPGPSIGCSKPTLPGGPWWPARLAARGAKAFGRTIGKAAKDERPALLERGKQMAAEVKEAEALEQEANAALTAARMAVPNIIEGAPPGGEQDYLVIKEVGRPPPSTSPRATTSSWVSGSAPSTFNAAPRCQVPASTSCAESPSCSAHC